MVLEDVPEETRLWKPETAPQATVTNKIGNNIAKLFIVETSVNWKHVKTKRCCQKETRNGANTRIEQHLKGIMLAQICSKNRHKRTVEEKNEKI